jgi:uridylate kinase
MNDKAYKRILLKLSGEVLMGNQEYGIDPEYVARLAEEVKAAKDTGLEICLVIGGGNIFRGVAGAAKGLDRTTGDYMGMLATVMNALAMQNALEQAGVQTRVQSAIPMSSVCEPYIRRRAERHLQKGRIVIFAAGTGNPFFTTDTGAALRAAEMNCDALLKGTSVDGVYDSDPKHNPDAKRFDTISYDQVLSDNLKVMDATAVALCRENTIPIVVFSIREKGNVARVLEGNGVQTIVGDGNKSSSIAVEGMEVFKVEEPKSAYRFEIRKNKKGEFVSYFMHNSETVWWTEGYSSKQAAKNAISSFLKNSDDTEIIEILN